MTRTDEQIKKDIIVQVFWDRRSGASDVQVEVSEGKVKLLPYRTGARGPHA